MIFIHHMAINYTHTVWDRDYLNLCCFDVSLHYILLEWYQGSGVGSLTSDSLVSISGDVLE